MLLPLHVVAGGLAIVLGAVVLLVRKGGTVHRRVGLLFVISMLAMGLSGSAIALEHGVGDGNVTGGLMSSYFVLTALTTVRPASTWTRWVNGGALAVAVFGALVSYARGVEAFGAPRGMLNGVPFGMLFFLGTVLALAAAGDVRAMWRPLKGGPLLARHLWRMCFALFIAAGSFFSIRARVAAVLPEPFTMPQVRVLLILLPFAAMFYWLWRVRSRRRPLLGKGSGGSSKAAIAIADRLADARHSRAAE